MSASTINNFSLRFSLPKSSAANPVAPPAIREVLANYNLFCNCLNSRTLENCDPEYLPHDYVYFNDVRLCNKLEVVETYQDVWHQLEIYTNSYAFRVMALSEFQSRYELEHSICEEQSFVNNSESQK